MTHEQYLLFEPKCREKISAAEEAKDRPSIKLYTETLAKIAQYDIEVPMSFEESIDLASDIKRDKDLCAIIDNIMGFRDGESATQVRYPMSVRGTIKKWKRAYPEPDIFNRKDAPLEPRSGRQYLRLTGCSIKEADIAVPEKYKDMLGPDITILPDNYGYGPDGFLGHTEYMTVTLYRIGARTGSCVVLGSVFDFREFRDGHTEYLGRIYTNLTYGFEDARRKNPKPDPERVVPTNRNRPGYKWEWIS